MNSVKPVEWPPLSNGVQLHRQNWVAARLKDTAMWYHAICYIVVVGLSFIAAPLEANGQPSTRVPVIGYLSVAGGAPGAFPWQSPSAKGCRT